MTPWNLSLDRTGRPVDTIDSFTQDLDLAMPCLLDELHDVYRCVAESGARPGRRHGVLLLELGSGPQDASPVTGSSCLPSLPLTTGTPTADAVARAAALSSITRMTAAEGHTHQTAVGDGLREVCALGEGP